MLRAPGTPPPPGDRASRDHRAGRAGLGRAVPAGPPVAPLLSPGAASLPEPVSGPALARPGFEGQRCQGSAVGGHRGGKCAPQQNTWGESPLFLRCAPVFWPLLRANQGKIGTPGWVPAWQVEEGVLTGSGSESECVKAAENLPNLGHRLHLGDPAHGRGDSPEVPEFTSQPCWASHSQGACKVPKIVTGV